MGRNLAKAMALLMLMLGFGPCALAQSETAVLTHHYDYFRTGWNSAETALTPYSLSSGSNLFGLKSSTNLDGPVFAQPLVVPSQQITCPANQIIVHCIAGLSGVYEVVYVATNSNSVYAINAANGHVLLRRNFGIKADCGGIVSTPVIDNNKKILYVMSHHRTSTKLEATSQPSVLHALNLSDLTDAVAPYTITNVNTARTLTDGSTYGLISSIACSRSALLLVGGNIYAGFRGSEYPAGSPPQPASGPSRGWVLGWNASTLAALTPLLTDSQAASPKSFFLSSIWMSGAGLASDGSNLYFSTGNSDPTGASYAAQSNIEESIVKVSSDLRVLDLFTPSNYATLDAYDFEIGSGGVMVTPDSSFVVGGGKDGRMFLLNASSLGGFTPGGPDNVLDTKNMGGCWCAPSYFMGPDGVGRIVSSGGDSVITWKLPQNLASPQQLVQDGAGLLGSTRQDPGFFTTVSSNKSGTDYAGIIWAVGRPPLGSSSVALYAFDATAQNGALPLLGQYAGGSWTEPSNANIVPVVANGKVYVAGANGAQGVLAIFAFLPQRSGALRNVILTAASYSAATGRFSSTVKNLGATAIPATTKITVAHYVNGQFVGADSVGGPLAAGASATIGASSITLTSSIGMANVLKAYIVQ